MCGHFVRKVIARERNDDSMWNGIFLTGTEISHSIRRHSCGRNRTEFQLEFQFEHIFSLQSLILGPFSLSCAMPGIRIRLNSSKLKSHEMSNVPAFGVTVPTNHRICCCLHNLLVSPSACACARRCACVWESECALHTAVCGRARSCLCISAFLFEMCLCTCVCVCIYRQTDRPIDQYNTKVSQLYAIEGILCCEPTYIHLYDTKKKLFWHRQCFIQYGDRNEHSCNQIFLIASKYKFMLFCCVCGHQQMRDLVEWMERSARPISEEERNETTAKKKKTH